MTISTLEACKAILEARGDAIVVSTMSAMQCMDQLAPDYPFGLSSVPLMGGAAGLGLGLALSFPERKVIILDGDASLLMELGVLATVAGMRPSNFYHFVFANGVQFNGGANLPVAGAGHVDFCGIARASGYAGATRFSKAQDLRAGLSACLSAPAPALIELDIEPTAPRFGPQLAQPEQGDARFERMGMEARRLMRALGTAR
ncbi:thiamine pyrophosphate-dependent enzyme [Achromobacter sp. UMC46]|uniref:thiamine pyrophosphate-dependent enzyme n=1 Tax=Achromobacter sp. UMC46 TaxID=1862319 RepID=UPI0016009E10|nr:thiamine pyrophosphate-dependent enzyme [Achromobacter sp. UMC46]MBB1594438.1 thiamine pyrophosphate-binding protein [Achromobacter sp. UMC46]